VKKTGCQIVLLSELLTVIAMIAGMVYSKEMSAKFGMDRGNFEALVIFGLPFVVPVILLFLIPFMPKTEDKYPHHDWNCHCGYHRKMRP
jgi:hypothetical protein